MRSELRALRERIRQVEAGGHRDTPLRRAYNRKLRALKILGGGIIKKSTVKADIDKLYSLYRKLYRRLDFQNADIENHKERLDGQIAVIEKHTEQIKRQTDLIDNLATSIDDLATMISKIKPNDK